MPSSLNITVTLGEWNFIGLFLNAFLYGVYSGVFALYLRYQASKKRSVGRTNTLLFYSLCILYVFSVIQVASATARVVLIKGYYITTGPAYITFIIEGVMSCCCDFIAQSILIYRCWIVWSRDIRVVIMSSILTFAYLVIWLAAGGSIQDHFVTPEWGNTLTKTGLSLSLTVNALTTSLIVFKIFMVYRQVKPLYGETDGHANSRLRPIMFILIESGMALFSIQLARLVATVVWTDAAARIDQCILFIDDMLNGLVPTIIQVRVLMGLSFHDESSLVEVTSSIRFGSNAGHSNSIPETGSQDIDHMESGDDGFGVRRLGGNGIAVQRRNDGDDSDTLTL